MDVCFFIKTFADNHVFGSAHRPGTPAFSVGKWYADKGKSRILELLRKQERTPNTPPHSGKQNRTVPTWSIPGRLNAVSAAGLGGLPDEGDVCVVIGIVIMAKLTNVASVAVSAVSVILRNTSMSTHATRDKNVTSMTVIMREK